MVEEMEKSKKKNQEIDRESLQFEFPNMIIGQVVRHILSGKDFQIKGMIQDDFPKSEFQFKRFYYSLD